MKKEDFNNLALLVLRLDGVNKWAKLKTACNILSIKLCPIYTSSKYYHKCEFYLNDYRFPESGYGRTISDSEDDVIQKFLNRYTDITKICASTKLVNEHDAIIISNNTLTQKSGTKRLFTELAHLVQAKKNEMVLKIVEERCRWLGITLDKLISTDGCFSCTLVLNGNHCPVIGSGSSAQTAFRWATENFLIKYFSTKMYCLIHKTRAFHVVAQFCLANQFSSPWRTVFNAGKLLGHRVNRRFVMNEPGIWSCWIVIDDVRADCPGTGRTHDDATNAAALLFVTKYRDLQAEERLMLAQFSSDADQLFAFLATECMDEFWSDNWRWLSEVCDERHLSLVALQRRVPDTDRFQCSMSVAEQRYTHSVETSDFKMGHNMLVQHMLSSYGRDEYDNQLLSTSDNEVVMETSPVVLAPQIQNDQDRALFDHVSVLCQSGSHGDAWKSLCNSSRLLNVQLKEKFVEKSGQFECECSMNDTRLDISGQGATRKQAAIDLAEQFIRKFDTSKSPDTTDRVLPSPDEPRVDSEEPANHVTEPDPICATETQQYKGVYFLNY